MANRKVLINYHTSGSSAPDAANVYQGELVVAHETGKETIFTKNNAGAMVPFVSCAQTIAMINELIEGSEDDVKAGTSEQHLEVATASTGDVKTWTLTTKDVQSENEFKAYSADTKTRIDTNASAITEMLGIVSALTDVVLTGISGDTIIVASEPQSPNSGANYVSLTHRTALETSGFKKLTTDAYGHVTASTDVTTADIQALGFLTSAETGEDLAELSASVVANETHINELSAGTLADIEALSGSVISYVNELSAGTIQLSADTEAAISKAINDLDSAISASTAGKYLTAVSIKDGLLDKIEEADIPELEVESAGTGNVVSSIAVDDHKITYQTISVATSEDIQDLSAATIALSAGTIHDIETLSGNVVEYVKVVSGNIETVINELSAGTEAGLEALSAGTIHDNEVLSADVITYINTISGYASSEIHELSASVVANETDIDNLSAATLDLSAVTLTGVSLNNTPLTVTDHVVSVPVAAEGTEIEGATENSDSGTVASIKAVKEYVEGIVSSAVNYKGATGSTPTAATQGDLYIANQDFVVEGSKSAETGDFIIYNGNNWDVIEKNLDGAITGNLTADTVTLGNGLNEVRSLANGANGTVLTMVDGAPAWANDPELSVVSGGTGNVITDITVNDHEITFTKGVKAATDADLQTLSGMVETISGYTDAKFTALSAGTIQLSADTKAAIAELSAGTIQLSADTKAAIAALSAGTIQLSADTKATFDQLSAGTIAVYNSATSYADDAITTAIQALDSVGSASTTGHYLTSVTIADGKITAVGEEAIPATVELTAETSTALDAPSAALTGVQTGDTAGHKLTFSVSNKIYSASTSDSAITAVSAITSQSAVTAVSAQTSVSANMAYAVSSAATITSGQVTDLVAGIQNTKVNSAFTAESADTAASADKVANKLTATDATNTVEYDGSAAKTLTFGTVGEANLRSMSMTNAGVVDVDVIDCGSY